MLIMWEYVDLFVQFWLFSNVAHPCVVNVVQEELKVVKKRNQQLCHILAQGESMHTFT